MVVANARHTIFRMAEVAVTAQMFQEILSLTTPTAGAPAPA